MNQMNVQCSSEKHSFLENFFFTIWKQKGWGCFKLRLKYNAKLVFPHSFQNIRVCLPEMKNQKFIFQKNRFARTREGIVKKQNE